MTLFSKKIGHQFLPQLSSWWWMCFSLFVAHQLLQKVFLINIPIVDSYLDPFLSIPIILGIHLTERRRFFKEGPEFVLPIFEVVFVSIFLAIVFEELWPIWFDGFVRDSWDYLGYGLGALFFIGMINRPLIGKK